MTTNEVVLTRINKKDLHTSSTVLRVSPQSMANSSQHQIFQLFPFVLLLLFFPLSTSASGLWSGFLSPYYLDCPGGLPSELATKHGRLSLQEFCVEFNCQCLPTGEIQCDGIGVESHSAIELSACSSGCVCHRKRWFQRKGSRPKDIFKTENIQPAEGSCSTGKCSTFSGCNPTRIREECEDYNILCIPRDGPSGPFPAVGDCIAFPMQFDMGSLGGKRRKRWSPEAMSNNLADHISCLCNSTFASYECCQSPNGMVELR